MNKIFIFMLMCSLATLTCFGQEVKNNSSSKDLKIRKQKFEQCIKSGVPRSKCLYLYY